MMAERRNDVGMKILSGIVLMLLGLMVNMAWSAAEKGSAKADLAINMANENARAIEAIKYMQADLTEIKTILRRGFRTNE